MDNPMSNDSQEAANVDPSLSIDDAAAHYGVSARTIRRYIKDRRLAAFKRTTERGFEWRVYAGQDVANDPDKDRQPAGTIDSNDRQISANVTGNDRHTVIEVVPARSELSRLLDVIEGQQDTIRQLQEEHTATMARADRDLQRLLEDNDLWKRRAIEAEEQVKLLMAPKESDPIEPEPPAEPDTPRSWWRRLFG